MVFTTALACGGAVGVVGGDADVPEVVVVAFGPDDPQAAARTPAKGMRASAK
jgi:hypothetical protein